MNSDVCFIIAGPLFGLLPKQLGPRSSHSDRLLTGDSLAAAAHQFRLGMSLVTLDGYFVQNSWETSLRLYELGKVFCPGYELWANHQTQI